MNWALHQVAFLLLAAVLALSVQAQTPVAPAQLMGRVVRADTGAPIEGAIVQLIPPSTHGRGDTQMTKTDRNGAYSFLRVKDGIYQIEASAEGFVHAVYRRYESQENVFQRFAPWTQLHGVDFHLSPEVAMRGLVMDGEDRPLDPSASGVEAGGICAVAHRFTAALLCLSSKSRSSMGTQVSSSITPRDDTRLHKPLHRG